MARPNRRHARKASATTAEEIMLPAELMAGLTCTLTPSSPPTFTQNMLFDTTPYSLSNTNMDETPTDPFTPLKKHMPLIPDVATMQLAPLFPEATAGSSPPNTPPATATTATATIAADELAESPTASELRISTDGLRFPDKGILKMPKDSDDATTASRWSLWPGAKKWFSEAILPASKYDIPEYPTFAHDAGIPAANTSLRLSTTGRSTSGNADGNPDEDSAMLPSRTAPSLDFERSTNFVPPLSQERIKSTEFWTNFSLELDPSKLKRIRFSMPIIVTEFDSDSSSLYAAEDTDTDTDTETDTETDHRNDADADAEDSPRQNRRSTSGDSELSPVCNRSLIQWDVDALAHRHYRAQEVWELYERTCKSLDVAPIPSVEKTLLSHVRKDQSLGTLDLTGSQLNGAHMKCFADMLDLNFGLAKLELSHCGIDDDAVRLLSYSLLCNDTVRYLSLANNSRLRSDGIRYISILVRHSKQLQLLDISGIAVRKKSAGYLAAALAGLGANWSMARGSMHKKTTSCEEISLQALRMNSCGIKPAALAILASGVRLSPLQHLSLRLNSLSGTAGPILREMLYGDPPQLTLNRQSMVAAATAAAAAAAVAARRPISMSLHALSDAQYYGGESGSAGLPMLGGYPGESPRVSRLRSLDLSQNDLGRAVMDLAEGLLWNTNLRSLLLRQNKLQSATLAPFVECLGINKGLVYLDISRNPVCGPTPLLLEVLAKVVTQNQTLKGLFMSGTNMTSAGAIILAECLPELQCLERLDVSENPAIDVAGLMALSASIKLNKSLICVEVTVNTGDDVCAALEQGIAQTCIANMQRLDPSSSLSCSSLFGFELVSAQQPWPLVDVGPESDIPGVLETKVSGENDRYECTSLVTDIAAVKRFHADSYQLDARSDVEDAIAKLESMSVLADDSRPKDSCDGSSSDSDIRAKISAHNVISLTALNELSNDDE